jgi:pentatricopeptide repeat protein
MAIEPDRARKLCYTFLDQMPNHFRNNTILLISLINILMRLGDVTRAERMFQLTQKKDLFTYTVI